MSYAYGNDDFSRYYDEFVRNLSSEEFWINSTKKLYEKIGEKSIENVDGQPVFVELGCGTGDLLIELDRKFSNRNVRLIGVDHSEPMLKRAKEKFDEFHLSSIELFQADLTNFYEGIGQQQADCIFLPAGTFHHLITDEERQQFFEQIQKTLRTENALLVLYLLPYAEICVELNHEEKKSEEKFQLIQVENRPIDDEFLSQQTFRFNGKSAVELSWSLRTCSREKIFEFFKKFLFEIVSISIDGENLISYNDYCSLSSIDYSTPFIVVVRTIKNGN